MAQIDYSQLQLIVENAMRQNGLTGDFENGWKRTITDSSGGSITQNYNFQDMRDATAKAILDALTNVIAAGTISNGNVQGVQTLIEDNSSVNITKGLPITSSPAARVGDSVQISAITDPVFLAWIASISAYTNIPFVGLAINGKISTGSSTVKLGD